MASYGFVTSGSTGKEDEWQNQDPYAAGPSSSQIQQGLANRELDQARASWRTPDGRPPVDTRIQPIGSGSAFSASSVSPQGDAIAGGNPYAGTQNTGQSGSYPNSMGGQYPQSYIPQLGGTGNDPYASAGNDPYAGTQNAGTSGPLMEGGYDPGYAGPLANVGNRPNPLQYDPYASRPLNSDGSRPMPSAGSSMPRPSAGQGFQPTWPEQQFPPDASFHLGDLTGDDTGKAWGVFANGPLQLMQHLQNNAAQQNEFGQNTYQWGQEFGQTQARDLDQSNLSWDGRNLEKWLAGDASEQWRSGLALEEQLGMGNLAMRGGELGLATELGRGELDLGRGRLGLETELGRGELALGQRELEGLNQFRTGQLGLGQRELEGLNQYREGQLGLGAEENRIREAYQTGQLNLGAEENRISALQQQATQAYQQGQLSLGQYEAEMARIAQQENLALNYAEMGSRETISREQMDNAYKTAVMNAVGRNQAQNIRFMRG